MDELQGRVATWEEANFPQCEEWELILGVCEEAGELAQNFLKMHRRIRAEEFTPDSMKDAIGDLLVYAAGVCNRHGWGLREIFEQTVTTVETRRWRAGAADDDSAR
jgi:NTP pyrophosphatase (non-canonical NTP hydrolase)